MNESRRQRLLALYLNAGSEARCRLIARLYRGWHLNRAGPCYAALAVLAALASGRSVA